MIHRTMSKRSYQGATSRSSTDNKSSHRASSIKDKMKLTCDSVSILFGNSLSSGADFRLSFKFSVSKVSDVT